MNIDNDDEGEGDEDDWWGSVWIKLNVIAQRLFYWHEWHKSSSCQSDELANCWSNSARSQKNKTPWWFCAKKFILLVIPKIEEENESKCELWYLSVRSWKSAIHEIENVSDIPYHPLHWHEDKFWWISENEGEEKWATHIIQLQSKIWGGKVN